MAVSHWIYRKRLSEKTSELHFEQVDIDVPMGYASAVVTMVK